MLQFTRLQTISIALLMLLGVMFSVPNLLSEDTRNALPGIFPKGTINLGLDLQGGSYLLLKVETSKVIDDRMKATMGDIRREMRPNRAANRERVSIDSISYNDSAGTISLRIANPDDQAEAEKRVREVTRGTTGGFGLGMRPYTVTAEAGHIEVAMTSEAQAYYSSEAVRDSIEVVRRRIDPAGNKEGLIAPQGTDRIVVQVPGDNDPQALKALINRTGQLSFHRQDPTVNLQDAAAGLLPPGRMYVPFAELEGSGRGGLVLYEDAEVTGDMVQNASSSVDNENGGFQINFTFDQRGARRFADYTRNNIGAVFAIVLDNEIISAPSIQSAITQGSGRITGSFTALEAAETSLLIRSGALPAELTTITTRAVVLLSTALFLLPSLFVGIVAPIVTRLAVGLSLLGSTLTLPGIAGIVLTIGMAVDANVLIFERIREEMLGGKTPIKAAEIGYEKARSAIIDANVTTFFAALIMFQLGAGPVRGFAITLAVGVVTSVFTAYVLTRLFVGGYLVSKRPKELKL